MLADLSSVEIQARVTNWTTNSTVRSLGNEALGVGQRMRAANKQVQEMWMEHGVSFSFQTHLDGRSEGLVNIAVWQSYSLFVDMQAKQPPFKKC